MKKNTLSKKIEAEKAFILDTIQSTTRLRAEIILSLARREHIDPWVWQEIGNKYREMSGPALDFLANRPAKIQIDIIEYMQRKAATVYAAITAITGEVLSDDAVYASELMTAWNQAPPAVREKFLREHGGQK